MSVKTNYTHNDVLIRPRDLDPELAYEASMHIDFDTASAETKLTWVYLMCACTDGMEEE